MYKSALPVLLIISLTYCHKREKIDKNSMSQNSDSSILYKDEFHFKNIRQITFGGSNAEAYWNFDDLRLCFQANHAG